MLYGSQALAVPLHKWKGSWITQTHERSTNPDDYYVWLHDHKLISNSLLTRMRSDITEGWAYRSDIPVGYGVGSSGAYVAALYERYISQHDFDLQYATGILSKMESYFHGASSGMDPLVSLTGKAVYKNEKGDFQLVDDPGWPDNFSIYLLDSGLSRETASLVTEFNTQMKDLAYSVAIQKKLIPLVEHAIHFYLYKENEMLEECISTISQMQRVYFEKMIPPHVKIYWDTLASKDGHYLKLCGAGGGGFFLLIKTKTDADIIEPFENSLLRIK